MISRNWLVVLGVLSLFISGCGVRLNDQEVKGPHGLILNEDNTHFFGSRPAEKMSIEGLKELIDHYAVGQVTQIFLNPNAMRTSYRSGVRDSLWDNNRPKDVKCPAFVRNSWLLYKKGIDPYTVWIDYCREKGVSPWISMRMNDIHHNEYLYSSFWRKHPEYQRGGGDYYAIALDYAREEVREYNLELIRELLERYDADGLELDWLREPRNFAPGAEAEGRKILTEFMRQVRGLVESWAKRRGHAIKIAVRVPAVPETAYEWGLDAGRWAKEGLIDMLVVGPRWQTADFDIPIEKWRESIGSKANDITIAAVMEIRVQPCSSGPFICNNLEIMRGFSAAMLERGADQIYLFNHFDNGASIRNQQEYVEVLQQGGKLETVIDKSRRYLVTWHDPGGPGKKTAHPLPADLDSTKSVKFDIYTGPQPKTGQIFVRVGLGEKANVQEAKLAVSLNGNKCKYENDCANVKDFAAVRVLQFEAEPTAIKQGYNQIAVSLVKGSGQQIVWVEIYIVP